MKKFYRLAMMVVITTALMLPAAFAGAAIIAEEVAPIPLGESILTAQDAPIIPGTANVFEMAAEMALLSDAEIAEHAAADINAASGIAIAPLSAPGGTGISLTFGPRVHNGVNSSRFLAGTGNIVYCLEQGRPFSNRSTWHTNSGAIANNQIRGILTMGFPSRSAAAIAADVPGVASLSAAEARMATQMAIWSEGWGNGRTVSIAAGNSVGASGARVLTAARWLANPANHPAAADLGTFYIFSHASGAARQRMIYGVGDIPAQQDPEIEIALIKTIFGSRGGLMADELVGVVNPNDGYVYYGPLSDSRFTLHTGTTEANARANALANQVDTRVGSWNLSVGTLRSALEPCFETGPDLEDWLTEAQLTLLSGIDVDSWNDRVAYLAIDDETQRQDLAPGWHAISETQVPVGYHQRQDHTLASNLQAGDFWITTFNNAPMFGHIHIEKRSSNTSITDGNTAYSLAGAQFEIRDMWGQYVGTVTTDAQGRANTYNLNTSRWACGRGLNPDGLPLGSYTITEVVAPPGFVLDSTPQTVRVSSANMSDAPRPGNWNVPQYAYYATATAVFYNEPTVEPEDSFIVLKVDNETEQGYPQGDATLTGAQFRIEFFGGFAAIEGRTPTRTWIIQTGNDGIARLNTDHFVSGDPLFTNSQGRLSLPLGTVRIQEIAPPTGYLINSEAFVRQITQSAMGSEIAVFVPPTVPQQVIRGDVLVEKRDLELGASEALGGRGPNGTTLEGIEFTITNSSPAFVMIDGERVEPGALVGRITTAWSDAHNAYVAYTSGGFLPYGTYTIQETATNSSYLLTDGAPRTFSIRSQGQVQRVDTSGTALNWYNQVVRGDFSFVKVAERTQERMSVPFSLTNNTTGEVNVLVTDRNGEFRSQANFNSRSLANVNNHLLDYVSAETTIPAASMNPLGSVWFGLGEFGSVAGVSDTLGALPYGSYTLRELRAETNVGFDLVEFDFFVFRNAHVLDFGTITNHPGIHISTFAECGHTGANYIHALPDRLIVDGIYFNNLIVGQEYTFRGILMDRTTGEPVLQNGEPVTAIDVTFTPRTPNGRIAMDFPVDLTGLQGRDIVVFQFLYSGGDRVGEYACLDNEDQTITVIPAPRVSTFAECGRGGGNYVLATEDALILDGIRFYDLIAGVEYVFRGMLMDKSTGEPLLVGGQEVWAEVTFVPEGVPGTVVSGHVVMTFALDGTGLGGRDVVVFQYLYHNDVRIGEYANIDNEDQTVTLVEPEVPYVPQEAPDCDRPAAPQETTPSAPAPAAPAAPERTARAPGLPNLGDVVNTLPLILSIAAGMLLSLFVGLKIGEKRGIAMTEGALAAVGADGTMSTGKASEKSRKDVKTDSDEVEEADGGGEESSESEETSDEDDVDVEEKDD